MSTKSTDRRNLKPGVPKTTIQNTLHISLRFHSFKIKFFHEIKNTDQYKISEMTSLMSKAVNENECV